jgi:hypothetical protein
MNYLNKVISLHNSSADESDCNDDLLSSEMSDF